MDTQSSKILFDRKTRMTTSIKAKLNKNGLTNEQSQVSYYETILDKITEH